MNDLLTLESDESGQENKFQLHMSVKNEITEEEDVLDSMSQPVTCDAGPMTTVSVGGTALSDGANSTNRILQVCSKFCLHVYDLLPGSEFRPLFFSLEISLAADLKIHDFLCFFLLSSIGKKGGGRCFIVSSKGLL